MGKISPVSAKYIIHAQIVISGVVDRPDVIGAIFGQTEGLLGSELELRELQRSGRIGRIEVNVETSAGKTNGTIDIPSSLDKSETSIVGAALEVIDREKPGLVLLDMVMPGMGGEATLKEIKKRYIDLTVLMVTVMTDKILALKLIEEGASGFISKPVDLDFLEKNVSIWKMIKDLH